MDYKLLFEKGDYALILRGTKMTQYAVVNGLNKERGDWAYTVDYTDFGKYSKITEIEALQEMIEVFRYKTEENYIPRCRLEELATQFKDGLVDDGEAEVMEYFDEVCEMTDEEKEFLGIRIES